MGLNVFPSVRYAPLQSNIASRNVQIPEEQQCRSRFTVTGDFNKSGVCKRSFQSDKYIVDGFRGQILVREDLGYQDSTSVTKPANYLLIVPF
jgi:hypothetical protein